MYFRVPPKPYDAGSWVGSPREGKPCKPACRKGDRESLERFHSSSKNSSGLSKKCSQAASYARLLRFRLARYEGTYLCFAFPCVTLSV